MKRVIKFGLPTESTFSVPHKIDVPKNHIIRKVGNQNEQLTVWIEVENEDDNGTCELMFMCMHTGDFLPANNSEFIDTVLFDNGNYVLHVYLLTKPK